MEKDMIVATVREVGSECWRRVMDGKASAVGPRVTKNFWSLNSLLILSFRKSPSPHLISMNRSSGR